MRVLVSNSARAPRPTAGTLLDFEAEDEYWPDRRSYLLEAEVGWEVHRPAE